MKSITFINPMNREQVVCENIRDIHVIDGVEYYKVHRLGQVRTFLMRKDVLKKVVDNKDKLAYNR